MSGHFAVRVHKRVTIPSCWHLCACQHLTVGRHKQRLVFQQYCCHCSWGGRKIGTASNIVFSNGLLDPWHGFGVLEDVSDSVVAVVIPEGAHHLDVSPHPTNPVTG